MTILGNFQRTWQLIGRHKCLPVWTVQRARPSKRLLLPQRRQACHLLRSTLISWASWMKGPGDPPKQRTRLWCPFTRHWRRWWGRWASYGNSWTIWGWAHQQTPRSCCDWLRWQYACWGRLYGRQLTGGACCGWPVSWAISSRRRSSWRTLRTCQWQVVNCLGRNSWRGCTGRHKARNRPEWSRRCWGPRRSSARASQRPSGPFEGAPPSDVGQAKPPGGALSNASQAMGGALPQPPPPPLSSHLPLPAAVAEDVGLLPGHQDKPGMSMHQSAMAVEGQYGPMWPMNMVMSKTGELSPWEEVLALPWGPDPCSTDPVWGKVSKCLGNWKVVTSDPEILSLVEGVKLDFAQEPPLSQQVRRGPSVPTSQEGRFNEAYTEPKTSQSVCKISAFQDGKPGGGNNNHSAERLVHQTRPQRRLFCSVSAPQPQKVPQVCVGQGSVPVCIPALRPGIGTKGVHQIAETSGKFIASFGNAFGPVPGRWAVHESGPAGTGKGQGHSAVCDDEARFHCELGEIRAKPQAGDRISGYDNRLPQNASFPATRQSAEYQGQVPAAVNIEVHNCTSGGETGREDCSVSEGGSARTTILQAATDAENAGFAGTATELRGGNNPHPGVQGRAAMVDRMPGSTQWPVFPDISAGHDYPDRCFKAGVGGSDGPGAHTRGLVSDGVKASHQYSRVESRQLCSQGLHQRDQGETCSLVDGQQHGGGLCQQPRGHKINEVDSGGQRALELLSCEQDHSYCRAPGGQTECRSRSGVQAIQGRQQLEARRDHFPGPGTHMGAYGDGPVCRQVEQATASLCQLEAGPHGSSDGCIHMQLEEGSAVCISPVLLDKSLSEQSTEGEGRASADNSNLEHTDMVSPSAGHASRPTGAVASFTGAVNRANRGPPPATDGGQVATGGMASVRQDREDTRISDQATRLMYEARRPGTRKAYRHPWDDWVSWCEERHVDPVQAPVGVMANFLTHKFLTKALEYRTVNVYRSAISAGHERVDGQPIGQHPTISQLMKGMFNRRPPQAKYTDTWDVELVLSRFRNMPENHDLELRELSLKLVMLLAITTASRSSELHKIQVSTLVDKGDEIQFHIAGLTKSRKVGEGPMVIRVAQYEPEGKLDVTDCVRTYLGKTAVIRQPGVAGDQLLISFIPPHGPLAPSSVARWLKWGLRDAGIDTSKYQAHSTRAAATSKAALEGLNMSQILQQANWSRAATFKKYYHKSVGCLFQEKVLNKRWTFIIMSN